jgi:hypothetical protein
MSMAANTLEQLRGLAEDSEAGTLLGGVAFGVGLLVVAYKAGRRICKWRKTRVAPLGVSASAIGLGPASAPPILLVPQAIVAPSVGNASFHTAPEDSSSDDEQPSGGELLLCSKALK